MISSDEMHPDSQEILIRDAFQGGLCPLNSKFHEALQIHQKEGDP